MEILETVNTILAVIILVIFFFSYLGLHKSINKLKKKIRDLEIKVHDVSLREMVDKNTHNDFLKRLNNAESTLHMLGGKIALMNQKKETEEDEEKKYPLWLFLNKFSKSFKGRC